MNRGEILVAGSALIALWGCAGTGELNIRPSSSSGLAAGEQPGSFRIAEARGHFALGNVALALEGFRRALREDTASVDAINGIAACYDRMGRFDLSRRYYEMALALAPADARLYANLALSLDVQGRKDEAAKVRSEMAARMAAKVEQGGAEVARAAPLADTQVSAPGPSVSLALAPARPEPSRVGGARLERISLSEVSLVTTGRVRWAPLGAESAEVRGTGANQRRPRALAVTLLNAARAEGLAARARLRLQGDSAARIAIGNARQVQRSSVIAYPTGHRAEALRVASRLGVAFRHRLTAGNQLVVTLGRDAVAGLDRRGG